MYLVLLALLTRFLCLDSEQHSGRRSFRGKAVGGTCRHHRPSKLSKGGESLVVKCGDGGARALWHAPRCESRRITAFLKVQESAGSLPAAELGAVPLGCRINGSAILLTRIVRWQSCPALVFRVTVWRTVESRSAQWGAVGGKIVLFDFGQSSVP
jgi:hypothetical protein